jgi:predicted amidohydrolase YtcJ
MSWARLRARSARPQRHRSLEEAQAKIAAYAAANPTPRWIVGRGWNQEKWGLGRFPTAADLDAVVGDRPVWLERVDGHAGWANSAAMRRPDHRRTAAPAGGGSRKWGASRPVFVDAAMQLIDKVVPPAAAAHATGALPRRRRYCCPTASPPSPTWAPAPRTGW